MRLDQGQIKTVRVVVEKIAGREAQVRVFGSRLNDFQRGGDLDLLVETDLPLDAFQRADMQMDLEEKLQLPVDIVFLEKGIKRHAFQELAYAQSQLIG